MSGLRVGRRPEGHTELCSEMEAEWGGGDSRWVLELGRRGGFWVLHSGANKTGCRSEVVTVVCVG